MNTTMQIRIDASTKAKAKKAFKSMGLTLSSGIKYMLTQVSDPKASTYVCPFGFLHHYTPKHLALFEREAKDALKGKGYKNVEEMMDSILRS